MLCSAMIDEKEWKEETQLDKETKKEWWREDVLVQQSQFALNKFWVIGNSQNNEKKSFIINTNQRNLRRQGLRIGQ